MKKKYCTESVGMFEYLNVWIFECFDVCMRGAINFSGMLHDVMKKTSHNLCLERLYSLLILWGFFQCILCLVPNQTHSFSSRCDSGTSPFAFLHKLFTKFDWQSSLTPLSDLSAFWLKETVATLQHFPIYANQHHCITSLWQPLFKIERSFLLYYTEKQQDWSEVAHNLSYYLVVNANNQDINNSTGVSW